MKKTFLKLDKSDNVIDIAVTNDPNFKSKGWKSYDGDIDKYLIGFESGKLKYNKDSFVENIDNRGEYYDKDGNLHIIDKFNETPDNDWVGSYEETDKGKLESLISLNDLEWRRNDKKFILWQKAVTMGWKAEAKVYKKDYDNHLKATKKAWDEINKLKQGK